LKKYLRLSNTCGDGFAEPDFANGDTSVYVELMQLLSHAFKTYCARNKVTFRIAG